MGKYDHLISAVPRPEKPNRKDNQNIIRRIAWTDESFMPGVPYFEIMWFFAPEEPTGPPTHSHTFDEIIGFIGSDPNNPSDLGATVKFLLADEWQTFTKSVLMHVPAGMPHGPMVFEDIRKPFIHLIGGPNAVAKKD